MIKDNETVQNAAKTAAIGLKKADRNGWVSSSVVGLWFCFVKMFP